MTIDAKARCYTLSSIHPSLDLVARRVTPQEIAVVDWKERTCLARFRTQQGTVVAVALHPDGKTVATLGEEGLGVWNSADGQCLLKVDTKGQNVILSETTIFVSDGKDLKAFDLAKGESLWSREHDKFQHPGLLAMSPDGKWLAWSAMGAPDIFFLDAQNGETVFTIPSEDEIYAIQFHPDGTRLATTVRTAKTDLQHHVQVWRLPRNWNVTETFLPERTFPIPFNSVSVAISPGGGTVVTGDAMGAQLWDYSSGSPERRLAERQTQKIKGFGTVEQPRPSLVSTVRFHSDGNQVITDGEYLRVWDAKSGELLWTYTP